MFDVKGILPYCYCFGLVPGLYFVPMKDLPRILLILLYAYALTAKLGDPAAFRAELYNQTFPHALAGSLFFAVPGAELLVTGLLLHPRTLRCGLWASLLLLCSFTGYIALVLLHYWSRVPCSCGGILSRMPWSVHLAFNCCLILINLLALYFDRREKYKGKAENLRKE